MRADPKCPQARTAVSSLAGADEPTFSIGALADEFGVSQRTLRFYEARGFLLPQRRGAERRYSRDDRKRIALILQAKRLGFTLREIRELVASCERHLDSLRLSRQQCTEQINLLEGQRRAIETALAELRQLYSSHYLDALARGEIETPLI